jgi:methionyl-tRNA formyltransferase
MANLVLQMKNMADHNSSFIFLGMPVTLSIRVLDGLLQARKRPAAVWIPDGNVNDRASIRQLQPEARRSELPLVRPYLQEGIVQLACEHDIPVFAIGNLSSAGAVAWLESQQYDIGIMACFPMRLSQEILGAPRISWSVSLVLDI